MDAPARAAMGCAGKAWRRRALRHAWAGFDLLVMGSHGHGNVGNLVMGSIATKVLAGCKVPVLLVR